MVVVNEEKEKKIIDLIYTLLAISLIICPFIFISRKQGYKKFFKNIFYIFSFHWLFVAIIKLKENNYDKEILEKTVDNVIQND